MRFGLEILLRMSTSVSGLGQFHYVDRGSQSVARITRTCIRTVACSFTMGRAMGYFDQSYFDPHIFQYMCTLVHELSISILQLGRYMSLVFDLI